MKTNLTIIAIFVSLMIPAASQADAPKHGGYMSGFIGVSAPQDTTVTTERYYYTGNDYPTNPSNDHVEFDPGINIGLTGGYDFGYFRMEGELSYKNASIKSIVDQSDNLRYRNVDGDLGVLAMMFNGFFDLHNGSPVTPYLGGGVGFATLYLSDTYGTNTRLGVTTRDLLYVEDDTAALAWQVGGGLEIAFNPMFSLDVGYRYFGTTRESFDSNYDQSTKLKFEGHNVAVGFRMNY